MKNEAEVSLKRAAAEQRFLERLRQPPELRVRFESILVLAPATGGPLQTADQVEELLIEALRQLGNVMGPIGYECRAGRYSAARANTCATTFMSVNTWERPPRVAAPPSPINGDAPNSNDSKPVRWPK